MRFLAFGHRMIKDILLLEEIREKKKQQLRLYYTPLEAELMKSIRAKYKIGKKKNLLFELKKLCESPT